MKMKVDIELTEDDLRALSYVAAQSGAANKMLGMDLALPEDPMKTEINKDACAILVQHMLRTSIAQANQFFASNVQAYRAQKNMIDDIINPNKRR